MSGQCNAGPQCVCGGDVPAVRAGCGNWRETGPGPIGEAPLTREERRRRSMLAPKCGCGNQARAGSTRCGRCEATYEAAVAQIDLTAEFRAIETEAANLQTYSEPTVRDVLALVERLAGAVAQARESE